MNIKLLVMVIAVMVMCVLPGKLVCGGSYQFQVVAYNVQNKWNNEYAHGCVPDGYGRWNYLNIYYVSGVYYARILNTYSGTLYIESSAISGTDGVNLSYYDTGEYFTGYDATYSINNVDICSGVIAINPANIAFAGNDAYFPGNYYLFLEFPQNNVPGVCWAGYMVNTSNGRVYFVGNGDCFAERYAIPDFYATPTPSPTPMTTPSPSPTSTPLPTPIPSVIPSVSPLPTDPPPVPQVGTLTGNIELTNNGSTTTGNFTASIQMPDQEQLAPYFKSGQAEENTINDVKNSEYDSEVPDVGQPTELEWTWLDSLLSALSNHPIISVITGSALTATSEVCELSCVIFGRTVTFSFCSWAWFFDDLGYFVLAFAVFYSVQIVFLYNR